MVVHPNLSLATWRFFVSADFRGVFLPDTENMVLYDLIGYRRGFHIPEAKEIPAIDPRQVLLEIHLGQDHTGMLFGSIGKDIELPSVL